METITNVPANEVGQVVQDFIDDDATHVVVERDVDGTFRVSTIDPE